MSKFVALSFIVLALATSVATGCSCFQRASANDYFCESNFVALITVTGQPYNCGFYQKCYPFKLLRPLKVDITELRKGLTVNATAIRTPEDEAMCGTNFETNEDYLIAGHMSSETGDVSMYLCNLMEDWTHMPLERQNSYMRLFEPKLLCTEREDD